MADLEVPATIRHGLTADMDWQSEEAVAHLRGVDDQMRPIQMRLTKDELDLLMAVQQLAEEQSGASA